jgi:hypothetical protein
MSASPRVLTLCATALISFPLAASHPKPRVRHAVEHNFSLELHDSLEELDADDILADLRAARKKSLKNYRHDIELIAVEMGGKPSYWANLWLASRGDRQALYRLLRGQVHGGFGINSQEWAEAFHLWGIFKLYAASDILIEWVSAANVLAGHHARLALRSLHPGVDSRKFRWDSETEQFQEEYRQAIKRMRAISPGLFRLKTSINSWE